VVYLPRPRSGLGSLTPLFLAVYSSSLKSNQIKLEIYIYSKESSKIENRDRAWFLNFLRMPLRKWGRGMIAEEDSFKTV
jgi:hypothetical protein